MGLWTLDLISKPVCYLSLEIVFNTFHSVLLAHRTIPPPDPVLACSTRAILGHTSLWTLSPECNFLNKFFIMSTTPRMSDYRSGADVLPVQLPDSLQTLANQDSYLYIQIHSTSLEHIRISQEPISPLYANTSWKREGETKNKYSLSSIVTMVSASETVKQIWRTTNLFQVCCGLTFWIQRSMQ